MSKKNRIGLMGGTFDPIHLGHLIIAETARERLSLDKIVFIPAGNPPHKDMRRVSAGKKRLKMIDLSIRGNQFFFSSDIELMRQGETYTIDTLRELKEVFEEDELFFITGKDAMDLIHTWKDYSLLFNYSKFVVVTRGSDSPYQLTSQQEKFKDDIIILDTPFIEISSTLIRNNVGKDISIRYMVEENVREYIYEQRLYLDPRD